MDTPLTHAWQSMYPPLQSHAQGWLDVGDGHEVYWQECGNPLGQPALFVHGGPGAGCTADDRRWFDPQRWRIVLFDQRGAGRSRPRGGLIANDTEHLLRDMETLRRHLHIERWLLFGGSWGSTLALAYAEQHPDRVHALVLRGVFTATASEQRWLYSAQGAAALYSAAWQQLTATIAPASRADMARALMVQMHSGDPATEQAAAQAWLQWEQDLMDLEAPVPQAPARQRLRDDGAALATARIGAHFACHAFFLEEGQLLAQADRLRDLPGVIVQGAKDLVTPPAAARALHRAWPGSRLQRIDAAGHASSQPAMAAALVRATDHFGAPAYRAATGHVGDTPMWFQPPPPQRSTHGKDELHR